MLPPLVGLNANEAIAVRCLTENDPGCSTASLKFHGIGATNA
jgi:hypothetical protein